MEIGDIMRSISKCLVQFPTMVLSIFSPKVDNSGQCCPGTEAHSNLPMVLKEYSTVYKQRDLYPESTTLITGI